MRWAWRRRGGITALGVALAGLIASAVPAEQRGSPAPDPRGASGELIVDDSCCPSPGGRAGSRFSADMASEFAAVIVVVDAAVLAAHGLDEMGDYIAVLSLSEADLAHTCGPLPSVLDDLATGCPASRQAATDSDVAFLKGLYSTNPTQFGFMQRASIADAMRRGAQVR